MCSGGGVIVAGETAGIGRKSCRSDALSMTDLDTNLVLTKQAQHHTKPTFHTRRLGNLKSNRNFPYLITRYRLSPTK
jgi:hypothetical protein